MSLGSTALGDAALGSTADADQTATASLAASDGDRATAAGTGSVAAAVAGSDADRSSTAGVRGRLGAVTAADADVGALAGTRLLAAVTTAQDADAATVAGQTGTGQVAALAASAADTATAAGTRGVVVIPTASDADRSSTAGARGLTAAVTGADADATTVAGSRAQVGALVAGDADRAAFGIAPNPITQTVERSLAWVETQSRTLDIDTMSDITPHDHYLAGESEIWEFTITKDGSDYDVSGADVSWHLLPLGADLADVPDDLAGAAVLSDDDADVELSISDPEGDGTSEVVTLTIDQGATGTLAGYYTHVLVLDDSGPGLALWSGDFEIGGI